MKSFSRSDRVAEQIRRELAEIIRLQLKDPRVGMITLTDVEVSPDYAHAKVYFTTLAEGDTMHDIEAGLRRAGGFLRRELGRRIHLHTLPELHFVFDASVERGARLSRLIDEALASSKKDGEA